MENRNLKDVSIGNIENAMHTFVDEKMTNKQKKFIASIISAIAVSSFRIGFQAANSKEFTEDEFNELLFSKTGENIFNELNSITFRTRV